MSLKTVQSPAALKSTVQDWKAHGHRVGFVPTMGALHEGHLSLVRLALREAGRVAVSIFVNPAQFAPNEDFASYPRKPEEDLGLLSEEGVPLVYMPAEKDIYPQGQKSNIKPGRAAEGLETQFRPHFFEGVVNVVHHLFEQVEPDFAVFGEKDFQQLQVIREMVEAYEFPVEIIGAPIIRDAHGLALSSRNAYLSEEALKTARQLNKILFKAANRIPLSPRSSSELRAEGLSAMTDKAQKGLLDAGFDKVDYVAARWNRLLAAVWIGNTRLIDNVEIHKT